MNTERVTCAICGVDDTEVIATKGDLTADITNVVCRRCGLVYINPRPPAAEYESFHVESFLKERHGISDAGDVARKVGGNDLKIKSAVLEFIRPALRSGVRVLDVGCGFGTLLHLVKKEISDAKVEGIELATVDVEAAKRFYNFDLYKGSLARYAEAHPDARFDLIILHHTFEHFPEPRAELRRMKGLLAPGGVIYIGVPDIMDIRKRPEIFFQLGHPYSYSPASLRKMLAAEGLAVVAWNPDAAFPGGMEILAEPSPPTRPEAPAEAMRAGGRSEDVVRAVRSAGRRFARMRGVRDRLLFFLPEPMRIAATRWIYILFKRSSSSAFTPALITALAGGLLFVLPHILIRWTIARSGDIYSFFTFSNPDPLVNLAPMLRDVIDGHWWVSDGRTWEHIGMPNLWSFADPIILAPFSFLLSSISDVFFVGHFLFPAIASGFLFLIADRITGRRLLSALFSIFTVAAGIFWTLVPPMTIENAKLLARSFFLGSPPGEILQSKYVSLSITPGIAFFAAAAFALVVAFERKSRWIAAAVGALVGLLIYIYITDAIYLLSALGIAGGLSLAVRDWARVRVAATALIAAAVIGSGYLWNFFAVRTLPYADEFYRRVGGEITHAFRWSRWPDYLLFILLAILVGLWGKRKKRPGVALAVAAMVLAGIAVLNMQVIVGFNPAPTVWGEHQLYLGLGLAWFIAVVWATENFGRWKRAASTAAAIVFFILIARVAQTEIVWAAALAPESRLPSSIARSIEWLEKSTPIDSVVASPSLVTNAYLPTWTHNRVLLPVAVTSPASLAEIRDRWLLVSTLFGVDPDTIRPYLERRAPADPVVNQMENNIIIFLYDSYFFPNEIDAFFRGRVGMKIPQEEVERLLSELERYPRRAAYLLNRYRIDYLYVGPNERRLAGRDFDKVDYLLKVYDDPDGEISIYKVDVSLTEANGGGD